MKLFILFPKESFYNSQSVDGKRVVLRGVQDVLDKFISDNTEVTYAAENTIAESMLARVANKSAITYIRDTRFVSVYGDRFEMSKESQDKIIKAKYIKTAASMAKPPVKDPRESTYAWLDARYKFFIDQSKKSMIEGLNERGVNVMVFHCSSGKNYIPCMSIVPEENDGRLVTFVNCDNGFLTESYMGGTYVNEDVAIQIVKNM